MAFVRVRLYRWEPPSPESGFGRARVVSRPRMEKSRVSKKTFYRSALTAFVLVIGMSVLAAGARQASILSSLGEFFTAGGTSAADSIEITGSLGSAYSTVPIQSATGLRIESGLLTGGSAPSVVRGDINGDSDVDFSDFLLFATAFGSEVGDPVYRAQADIDSNGTVDFGDFLTFAQAFGG